MAKGRPFIVDVDKDCRFGRSAKVVSECPNETPLFLNAGLPSSCLLNKNQYTLIMLAI